MHLPYTLQLAHGWTRLTVWVNSASLLVLAPAIYLGVSTYGVEAAAVAWILLNAGYVIIGLPLMHRRLLPAEKWRWYGQDVLAPLCAALAPLLIIRALTSPPALSQPLESMAVLAAATITVLVAAILVTPLGRSQVNNYFRPVIQS
jgi:O-antigen/teichoic acid export membrane protein